MNNKLRKQILKELNFLLNEQEATGAGYFSEDLNDIIKDINNSEIKEEEGFKYLDLTTVRQNTDEGELSKFISSAKRFKDESKIPTSFKDAMSKMCVNKVVLINRSGWFLYNSFGTEDAFYTIACKKIGNTDVTVSAKFAADESDASLVAQAVADISGTTTPDVTPQVTPQGPGVSPIPGQPTEGEFGRSFRCQPLGLVAQFQNWLKKQGQKICADDKFGKKTFAAAKAVGNAVLDFSMYNSLEDFRDTAKRNKLCSDIAGDSRWRAESSTPETCKTRRRRRPIEDTTIAPEQQSMTLPVEGTNEVMTMIKQIDSEWNRGSYVNNAYLGNREFARELNNAYLDGRLTKDFIKEKYNELASGLQIPMEESKNFYDNKKLIEAKLLFNKLIKDLI